MYEIGVGVGVTFGWFVHIQFACQLVVLDKVLEPRSIELQLKNLIILQQFIDHF